MGEVFAALSELTTGLKPEASRTVMSVVDTAIQIYSYFEPQFVGKVVAVVLDDNVLL